MKKENKLKNIRKKFSSKFFLIGCGCGVFLVILGLICCAGIIYFLTTVSPVVIPDYNEPEDSETSYTVMAKLQKVYKNIMFATPVDTADISFSPQEMNYLVKTEMHAQELKLNESLQAERDLSKKKNFISGEFKKQKFHICYSYRINPIKKFSLFFTIDTAFFIKIKDKKVVVTFIYLKIGKLSIPPWLLNSNIGNSIKNIFIQGDLMTKLISELEITEKSVYIKYHPAKIRDIMINYIFIEPKN